MVISRPQREPHEKRIWSSGYSSHVLPAAKRHRPGIPESIEDVAIDVSFAETVLADSNNDHEMTILDGASNLDLSSISAAIPMQASLSQAQMQPQVKRQVPYINNMHSFQEVQFATHSGTSFISHSTVSQRKKRTCKPCKDAGQSGLNCPRSGNRLQCKFRVSKYYFGKICADQFISIRMHKINCKKYC